MVIGIDPRNREFGVERLLAALGEVDGARPGGRRCWSISTARPTSLVRRYSETRRRHPLSPHETPLVGIEREMALLAPLRERADVLIDTRAMTPHELRAEMARQFGAEEAARRAGGDVAVVLLQARRCRAGVDMVIDVRFLKNPHWEPELRPLDGRDPAVRGFVEADPAYAPFYERLVDLLRLPAAGLPRGGKELFRPRRSAAPAAGTDRWRWWRRLRKRLQRTGGRCLFDIGTWSGRPATSLFGVGAGTS